MEKRFYYSADVTITLANGDEIRRNIDSYVMASYDSQARNDAPTCLRDEVYDWDCNKVDAPVESVEIHNITFHRD